MISLPKITFCTLWLGFIIYAFVFAPPDSPETWRLIQNLSTGQLQGINPLIIALFNIMGVMPLLYSLVLYADGRGQRVPAWPFAAASFGVGAFAILPYLLLREPKPEFVGEKTRWLKIMDSRWTAGFVAIALLSLLTYGLSQGNWADLVQQWQTSRFIHVMSLDFVFLCLLFPTLVGDDMARRGMDRRFFWAFAGVPLLGAIAYVLLRPSLQPNVPQPSSFTKVSTQP
jgi:hypothetical protein